MPARCLLVVAAHPDDEVLGCGATVRRLVNEGWTAHLAVLTAGIGGRHPATKAATPKVRARQKVLHGEMNRAARILGFSSVAGLGFPDNRMDTVSRMDIVHALRAIVGRIRPRRILTHHPGDYNWDHTLTFEAVMMAARHSPGDPAPDEIWSFEVRSSTERGWQYRQPFGPTLYVDIAATLPAKEKALRCYRSELHRSPHPRSVEGIRALAAMRGHEVGLDAAEAFELIRGVI